MKLLEMKFENMVEIKEEEGGGRDDSIEKAANKNE